MTTENTSAKQPKHNYDPIRKGDGVTAAERYLNRLCSKTFLSLWSYPAVYRDQGKPIPTADGKEVCDLLVVFGQHIILFSDKNCDFQKTADIGLAWARWFRRAIWKSALQIWGASRWMREQPSRIFLDRECRRPLPISLPARDKARYHLITVAHGISEHVATRFGGSGSLMINSKLAGLEAHTEPFYVGDLDPSKAFIHVFDDCSLHMLMKTRDTISDFVAYLEKRECLIRGPVKILATGEEELLAVYLKNMNHDEEHDFVFPQQAGRRPTGIFLTEGHWEAFQNNAQRMRQLARDEISYLWDRLIEKFNHYALRGEQYYISDGGFKDAERILRFMAREPRFKRRYFAQALTEMLETTPASHRRLRIIPPMFTEDPYYVLLLFPMLQFPPRPVTEEEYRTVRQNFLYICCLVTKLKYPDAEDVVGIATESGMRNPSRSEDACYFDARGWNGELEKHAKEAHEQLGILKAPTYTRFQAEEYPSEPFDKTIKYPRNSRCPCGSGKNYKYCCLNR
jgi:hypothetical protein